MRSDMVTAYVRELLEEMTGMRPEPDHDGDLPIRHRGASFYVRVLDPLDPYVQVFAVAVADIGPTPGLLGELNLINTRLRFARAFHVAGQVLFETEIWGTDVNPGNISHACRTVASATDEYGLALADAFGGRALFEESKDEESFQVPAEAGNYL